MPQPTARNHSVSLEQLDRAERAHFRRDHAGDVIFDRDIIDDRQTVPANNTDDAPEDLAFAPLPMKTDADRYVVEGEGGSAGLHRCEFDFGREVMAARRIGLALGVDERTAEFDIHGVALLHQAHRDIHQTSKFPSLAKEGNLLSKRFRASSNGPSGSVTSSKMRSMSTPRIRSKSERTGTTKIPHRSIAAGLTVSSPVS